MAERIAYRILGGIVQRDKTRDLPIRNIEILRVPFFRNPNLQWLIIRTVLNRPNNSQFMRYCAVPRSSRYAAS